MGLRLVVQFKVFSPAPRLAKDFFDVWQILMAFIKPVLDTLDAALAFWSTDR